MTTRRRSLALILVLLMCLLLWRAGSQPPPLPTPDRPAPVPVARRPPPRPSAPIPSVLREDLLAPTSEEATFWFDFLQEKAGLVRIDCPLPPGEAGPLDLSHQEVRDGRLHAIVAASDGVLPVFAAGSRERLGQYSWEGARPGVVGRCTFDSVYMVALTVQVVDGDGLPREGVTVKAGAMAERTLPATVTDAHGEVVLEVDEGLRVELQIDNGTLPLWMDDGLLQVIFVHAPAGAPFQRVVVEALDDVEDRDERQQAGQLDFEASSPGVVFLDYDTLLADPDLPDGLRSVLEEEAEAWRRWEEERD